MKNETKLLCIYLIYLRRAGCNTRSNLSHLRSDFSIGCHVKVKELSLPIAKEITKLIAMGKAISTMWNTNSFAQRLNFGRSLIPTIING